MLVCVVDGGWPLYFCCTVGTVVAGIGILRARKRGLERIRDLERQNALELERLRIAQDMHDGLGADLTRIAMLAELARRESGSEGAQRHLEQVAGIARGLVDHISELVWATNPRHNALDALAAYLHQYTSELLEPRGLISRFEIPNPLPPIAISGELRRHLLLATKEVLNNTLKHAGASEVRFRSEIGPRRGWLTADPDPRAPSRPGAP